MKYSTNMLLATFVAGAALSGCSAESNTAGSAAERFGSVEAQLKVNNNGLAVGGKTGSVAYDLTCGTVAVKTGVLPVPLDGSTISGFIGSVRPASDCQVTLTTTVTLDKDLDTNGIVDDKVTCSAVSAVFNVVPGGVANLGNIVLTCRIDETADIRFAGQIDLVNQSLDTYFVGPLSIVGEEGVIPPVSLTVGSPTPGVSYLWTVVPATGGSFNGCSTTPENCTFTCGSDGNHSIQLTANFGGNTLTRTTAVSCVIGVECGNGTREGSEQCDDGNKVAGDGCNATCQTEFCGDNVKNNGAAEQCDDGNTNDNDLCGNDCKLPVCGDGDVEGTETCDDTLPTCVACQVVAPMATCGDGIVNQPPEQCDTAGASATCTVDCKLPAKFPACPGCLDAQIPENLNQACSANAECAAVRDCVVDSECFQVGGSPSLCYCGPGATIDQCVAPAFAPTGACVAQIRAAMTKDGQSLDNSNVVGVLAADGTTSGQAFGILIPASQFGICIAECGLNP